jgi:hypothetical protein
MSEADKTVVAWIVLVWLIVSALYIWIKARSIPPRPPRPEGAEPRRADRRQPARRGLLMIIRAPLSLLLLAFAAGIIFASCVLWADMRRCAL